VLQIFMKKIFPCHNYFALYNNKTSVTITCLHKVTRFFPVIQGQPSPTMRMMHISTNAPPTLHLALVNGEYVFQFTVSLINSLSVTLFTNSTLIT
jgi:hypothetical protein